MVEEAECALLLLCYHLRVPYRVQSSRCHSGPPPQNHLDEGWRDGLWMTAKGCESESVEVGVEVGEGEDSAA